MVDRLKVETILTRRFPGAPPGQIAAAANAIMGLPDEWEEILHDDHPSGYHVTDACGQTCRLMADGDQGIEFRLFKRREPSHQ